MAKTQAKKKPAPAKKALKQPAPKQAAKKPAAKLVKKAPAKIQKKAATPAKAAQKASKPSPTKAVKPTPSPKKSTPPMTKTTAKTAAKSSPIKERREYKPVKLPAGYKPTASETYMSPQQQEYFRQKLLAWRKGLMDESRETLDHLHEENWHQADIADRAALETEAGVELRTRNRYLKLVSKIDAAIMRIEDGEYGYCEETGEPIGLKRLEARPVATLSIEAQERHEKNEKQYIDED
jgi:DnaK suppressor protein